MPRSLPVMLATTLLLGACSWGIRLDSGGRAVHTVWTGSVVDCVDKGRVTVSVLDHVGPVSRNDLKVRDELNVLARNHAASIGADTIQPLGEPRGGEQSFAAWHCGRTPAAVPAQPGAPRRDGAVQTYPVKD